MELLDGRYQIKEVLGRGGFGKTFLAEDTELGDYPLCVVKQLQPDFSDLNLLEKAKDLFDREAETLAMLGKHSHIPTLLAYFKENDEFYIVQEYIDGHTLEQELIPNRPLSEQEVIEIIREILEIIQFVHSYSVIHRDIKPSNLIRRKKDNNLVLIDFGSVKKITTTGLTKATIIGSYAYIPEEQFNGTPNFRSDLYAVGMIGIQALTGIEFKAMLGAGFSRNQQGELSWQKYAKVSNKLADFLSTMVRHNYNQRYQSATEALQALQDVIKYNQVSTNSLEKNWQESLNVFSKILLVGSITVATLGTIVIARSNISKQQITLKQLPLNGNIVESSLERKDKCKDSRETFYCEKYFFFGKKDQKIIIQMNSKDFNPYLLLLQDDNQSLVVTHNTAINKWTTQIVATLPQDGNYILIAKSSNVGELGSYRIRALGKF